MDLIGATIEGKYRILSVLGAGGAGTVYKAEQEDLTRFVAIKVLHKNNENSDDRLKLIREAKNLSAGQDPSIIKVLAVGVLDDDSPYLVMEYVEGETLDAFIAKKGALSVAETIEIGMKTSQALSAAHSSKLIHRDLKPANILIEERGSERFVKILDFGLAKSVSQTSSLAQRNTATGAIVGSIAYMAPEVCSGQQASAQSDVYALGCILYECLVGHAAFVSDNILALLNMHREELPTSLCEQQNDIPADLELIVFKCIQKEPRDRFASADELFSALDAVKKGRSLEATLDGVITGSRAQKKGKTKSFPLPVMVAVAISLSVFVVCVAYLAENKNAPQTRSLTAMPLQHPKSTKKLRGINADTIDSRARKMILEFEDISDGSDSQERARAVAFIPVADGIIKDTGRFEILYLAWFLKGRAYAKLSDPIKSLDAYKQSLSYAIDAAHGKEPYQAVYSYSGIIHEAEALQDYATAENAGLNALNIIESSAAGKTLPVINIPYLENARLLNFFGLALEHEFNFRLARVELALGKLTKARKHAERALSLAESMERGTVYTRVTLSNILSELNESKLALVQASTCEKLLAELSRSSGHGEAMPTVSDIFNGTANNSPEFLLEQYRLLANYYVKYGYKQDAVRVFNAAIDFAKEHNLSRGSIEHMELNVQNLKSQIGSAK